MTSNILEKVDCISLFICLLFTVSIKHPDLDFLKKVLSNDKYYLPPIVLPGWQLGHQQTSSRRIPLKWQKPADNNKEHALSQSQYATNHT